jgi:hypothetical protein
MKGKRNIDASGQNHSKIGGLGIKSTPLKSLKNIVIEENKIVRKSLKQNLEEVEALLVKLG